MAKQEEPKIDYEAIAKKIVKKHGKYEVVDHEPFDELDEARTVHSLRFIDVYGETVTFHGESEKDVNEQAIEHYRTMLDEENLVLSSEIIDEL